VTPFNSGPYADHWFEKALSLRPGRERSPHCSTLPRNTNAGKPWSGLSLAAPPSGDADGSRVTDGDPPGWACWRQPAWHGPMTWG
jgi:hypothetical protein